MLTFILGSVSKLSCKTNIPWSSCIWEGPKGFQCDISKLNVKQCKNSIYILAPNNTNCAIEIGDFEEEHSGTWKCKMINNAMDSANKSISLSVAKSPSVILMMDGKNYGDSYPLDIEQGETKKVRKLN